MHCKGSAFHVMEDTQQSLGANLQHYSFCFSVCEKEAGGIVECYKSHKCTLQIAKHTCTVVLIPAAITCTA